MRAFNYSPRYANAVRVLNRLLDKEFLSAEEIRLYDDFFIVEYENQNDPDINYGFGTLFKYISKDIKNRH